MSGADAAAGPDRRPRFEVWRQDDNGQRFLVSAHADRAGAEAVVAGFESGVQHKQLYFVRERDGEQAP